VSLGIVALVLAAACMHAGWNALVKTSRHTGIYTSLVAIVSSIAAALILPFVPLPAIASWPYLAASCIIELIYFRILAAVYRQGDLSYAYPLMRGLAPPLVALVGSVVLHDAVTPSLWAGVATISIGVLWISGGHRLFMQRPSRVTALALMNAGVIATYTLVDGIGVRLSGNAASYGLWLFFLIGIPMVPMLIAQGGSRLKAHLHEEWWRGVLGGLLNVAVYIIVLWAMTQAPIAAIAALRETSVIFAALTGALLLKEPFGRNRVIGAGFIVIGVALLRAD
jgi:drug/metabolite transporter (DMT)-like permease